MKKANLFILLVLGGLLVNLFMVTNGMAYENIAPAKIKDVRLALDGRELFFTTPACINNNYHTMITLPNIAEIFACQTEVLEENHIKIYKENVDLTMQIGESNYTFNSLFVNANAFPYYSSNNEVLVPLRIVSEAMGYNISYHAPLNMIILQSPDFSGNAIPIDALPEPAIVPPQPQGTWGVISETSGLVTLAPNQTFVSGYYTKLLSKQASRTNNIQLSCASINGKVLAPGEVFSFNQTVGERTAAKGYQSAPIFSGKQVIQGIGGGICQTASTLYNAVLEANLTIIERRRHSLAVAYVPAGRDATVAWGSIDFKFKNSRDYPLKVLARVEGDYVIIALVGEI
ncbi:MAG: VanW family protein [Syntrophomonadaceae bacterium]|jgi:hypothetical protein